MEKYRENIEDEFPKEFLDHDANAILAAKESRQIPPCTSSRERVEENEENISEFLVDSFDENMDEENYLDEGGPSPLDTSDTLFFEAGQSIEDKNMKVHSMKENHERKKSNSEVAQGWGPEPADTYLEVVPAANGEPSSLYTD